MESLGQMSSPVPAGVVASTSVSLHFPSLRWVIIGFLYLLPLIHRLIAYFYWSCIKYCIEYSLIRLCHDFTLKWIFSSNFYL